MKNTNMPMATGVTTPIRLIVSPGREDQRDLNIAIEAGRSNTTRRVTRWDMECHPSWWWEFGPAIVESAIIMSIEGVLPTEWPRRLDAVVKSVYTQLELGLEEHHPGR